MSNNIPERFLWAKELLQIKTGDHVLEIGCGAGLLAEQICGQLSKGSLVAVDKSAPMIEKAKKRNSDFVEKGFASFIVSDFKNCELPLSYFDTIVAFNVNLFWKDSLQEFEKIKRIIKHSGRLYVFYQAPYEITKASVLPIQQQLRKHSFEVLYTEMKKLVPTSACCISAKLA